MSGIVYKAVAFYDTKHFHFNQIVIYIHLLGTLLGAISTYMTYMIYDFFFFFSVRLVDSVVLRLCLLL